MNTEKAHKMLEMLADGYSHKVIKEELDIKEYHLRDWYSSMKRKYNLPSNPSSVKHYKKEVLENIETWNARHDELKVIREKYKNKFHELGDF